MANRICKIEDCEGRVQGRGMCSKHYTRWRKHGDPTIRIVQQAKGLKCDVENCDQERHSRGFCKSHLYRWHRYGDPEAQAVQPRAGRTCEVDDCDGPVLAKDLCNTHYHRLSKYGDPLGLSPRDTKMLGSCSVEGCGEPKEKRGLCNRHYQKWTRYGDPKEGREFTRYRTPEESFAARTERDGECLVWTGTKLEFGYGVITAGPYKAMPAHRWAWEQVNGPIPEGMVLDHMCWNPPCVRVDHLRVVTQGQNAQNRKGANPNNKSSGIRGVTLCRKTGRWIAAISILNRRYHLGQYDSKEAAGEVARLARLKYYTHSDSDRRVTDLGSSSATQFAASPGR